MKKKNLPIDNLPKDLNKEVKDFCKLNDIEDINDLILSCFKGGFAIEKYGLTPSLMKPQIINKEIEKEVPVEVEKIVEKEVIKEVIKEVPVEKIVEVEKIVTETYINDKIVTELNNLKKLLKTENPEGRKYTNKEYYKVKQEKEELKIKIDNLANEKTSQCEEKIKDLNKLIKKYEDILSHFQSFSQKGNIKHLKSSNIKDIYKE